MKELRYSGDFDPSFQVVLEYLKESKERAEEPFKNSISITLDLLTRHGDANNNHSDDCFIPQVEMNSIGIQEEPPWDIVLKPIYFK